MVEFLGTCLTIRKNQHSANSFTKPTAFDRIADIAFNQLFACLIGMGFLFDYDSDHYYTTTAHSSYWHSYLLHNYYNKMALRLPFNFDNKKGFAPAPLSVFSLGRK